MTLLFRTAANKVGLPPGTLKGDDADTVGKLRIACTEYSARNAEEREVESIAELLPRSASDKIIWINIESPTVELLNHLNSELGIHPLVLEDILHLGQRPKIEDHKDYVYIVAKMVYTNNNDEVIVEQVSILFGPDYLITFQERIGDVFEQIRNRIRLGHGQIRKQGADYLAYALLDAIIDNYFSIIEVIDEKIEAIDNELVIESNTDSIHAIHTLKRHLILMRKQVWPVRELVTGFMRNDSSPLISDNTRLYLRDLYEHIIQVIEMVESFREMLASLHDVYLSIVSNRMNEIMKVLTIFAAIFIPLTFIAGIYGMNFEYMPELGWRWSYFVTLGVMALATIGMLIFFKRKRWF